MPEEKLIDPSKLCAVKAVNRNDLAGFAGQRN